MIVVDASVAVKWVTGEQGWEAANQLLKGGEPVAGPLLLRTEVAAAFARRARFGDITTDDGTAALELWLSMLGHADIDLIPEDPDLPLALNLPPQMNHPLQDCVYLALAERLDAPLVTADEQFAAKGRKRHPCIRPLARAIVH
jgi:predicted nucleic acid-binding protein